MIARVQVGDRVNIETDLIGKYVQRLIVGAATTGGSALTWDTLRENGFVATVGDGNKGGRP